MALYLVIQVGAFLSRLIPRPWRYLIGAAVGDAVFWVWGAKRRVLLQNMATVMGLNPGDRRVRRMALRSMRNYCKYLIEFLELPVLSSSDEIISSMKISGVEHLQNALSAGKGVILASAHFGTIEIGGLRLKDFTDFYAVYDSFTPDYLDRSIQEKRRQKGINLVPVTNIRKMIRVLHADGSLVMLYDRPVDRSKGVPVQFFGRETAVPGGPAALALKTGATILPVYMFRHPDKSFESVLFPPIEVRKTGNRDADVQATMQALMSSLEAVVRSRPDQWYMFRPMWPEAPRGQERVPRAPLSNWLLYGLLRVAGAIVPRLPARFAYKLADAAGTLAYHLVPRARAALVQNLSTVTGTQDSDIVAPLARRAFQNDARNWADTLRITSIRPDDLVRGVAVEGWEHVEEALSGGRGLVMVTLHLGNFDLVGQILALRGLKLTVPVERMLPEGLFDFLVRRRASNGINIVPIERAPREMVAALRRGEIVGLAGDRGAGGKTVPVTLFGRQTTIPRGPVTLARRARAPMVVAIGVRMPDNSFRGYVTPQVPLTYAPGEANEERDAQALADAFAPFLARFPDQWLAFTPMWPRSSAEAHAGTIWATNRGGVGG